jgi:hypothetical protein
MERLKPSEVFRPIFQELCVSHSNEQAAEKVYDLLDLLLQRVPVYMLTCTMARETARLARDTLTKDKIL